MFEKVISPHSIKIIKRIYPFVKDFYLAGGTALALQFGHRKSFDFDFFTQKKFNVNFLINHFKPSKIEHASKYTLNCEINNIRFSFLFYEYPLTQKIIMWNEIKIAHWKDIVAEKIKTVSQRGAKKDFYDLYFAFSQKISVQEAFEIFNKRFKDSGINKYHVLKSLVYFEDAEKEPDPVVLVKNISWQKVKSFFISNIKNFESILLSTVD